MGILYIVATPIGNLEDITIRAIKTLFNVDYIACEDTRHTGQLLASLKHLGGGRLSLRSHDSREVNGIPKLISYYDEIEFKRVPEIIELLTTGKDVVLVSDSGTPLISDPGFKLVKECIKRGIRTISIPGPTSLITALTSSGLPPNNFLFLGYLPAAQSKRLNLLTELQLKYCSSNTNVVSSDAIKTPRMVTRQRPRLLRGEGTKINPTIIFFETPHRLKESLEDLKEVFGDIEIVICRELTKIHEEVYKGKVSETMNKDFKGELVIVVSLNV